MNRVVPRCLPASPVPAKPELREHQEMTLTQSLLPQIPQSGFPCVGKSAGSAHPGCKKWMGKPNRLFPFASSQAEPGPDSAHGGCQLYTAFPRSLHNNVPSATQLSNCAGRRSSMTDHQNRQNRSYFGNGAVPTLPSDFSYALQEKQDRLER
ncbi:uncharacterized protein M6G45_008537 [Spheniscus humboldti]